MNLPYITWPQFPRNDCWLCLKLRNHASSFYIFFMININYDKVIIITQVDLQVMNIFKYTSWYHFCRILYMYSSKDIYIQTLLSQIINLFQPKKKLFDNQFLFCFTAWEFHSCISVFLITQYCICIMVN